MDADTWKRVKAMLAAALERPAGERLAFLAAECPDEALRAEVIALLESYDRSDALESLAADDKEYELQPGTAIGPYTIVHPVGRGGGGEVYRARDTRLQRNVALKLLLAAGGDEGARRLREARAAAQLNHRGIAAIYDIVESGPASMPRASLRPCIIMEYVPGRSLADRLREEAPDWQTVAAVGREMSDAVAHAHAARIVHCDLKPGNMRFGADGSLKILDFGLARRSANAPQSSSSNAVSGLSASSLHGLALGTPGYMAPEQLLGGSIDFRTDVYALGVVLYEMSAGRRPFQAGTGHGNDAMSTAVAVLSSPLPDLPRELPRRLRHVILKALNRRPDDRYANGAELRDALDALAPPKWLRTFAGWKT